MEMTGYEFSDEKRDCKWFLRNLFVLRSIVIVLVAVTVPIPLLIEGSVEFKCAYVVIVMAILWLTEALPIPVTALMPIFLFPMLGDTTILLLGGLIVAVAVEEVNLHKRIALGVIKMIGAQPNIEPSKPKVSRMSKGFALCVCYAANIGGISTLTGTPPNLVLQGQANQLYAEKSGGTVDSGISFAKWMGFALPMSIVILILSWIWLQIVFLGLSNAFIRDSSAAIFIAVLLFILPIKPPNVFCWNKLTEDGKYEKPKYTPILNWQTTAMKVPWGVVLLLGGGFAMAHASTESGLSKWVGHKMEVFSDFEPWVMNFVLSCIAAGATEVTSNSATATLLMPIMANLAIAIGSHPLYLMISATISCSFAFMLPVATPPNAIALTGIMMNIIALLGLALAMNTWASPIFGLDSIPEFFKLNATATTIASI
ncbi:hypothetical protein KUTeg_004930 [Tegillarca granosa]|uniref:Citrate transporter-like domain-containing protein n=1 Tax=Tegillarca granosa TaxID=220873 RepID=A0ABQ9FK43_TEGGR|nr:hypothetical protein KUTeg_004930 [Tegillarca granosa]